MLLLSYIKKHILFHIVVFIIYGALFLLMLTVTGEMFHEKGYDHLSNKDTTYTFRLYTNDKSKINSILKSINDCADVCLVSENSDYIVMSFYTPISENRYYDADSRNQIQSGEISYSSSLTFYSLFSDQIDSDNNTLTLMNKKFTITGIQNVQISLPVEADLIVYTDIEDFWDIAGSESILLSVLRDELMSESELETLMKVFSDNGVTVASYLPDRISFASKVINSDEIRMIYIMVLLTCLCFARLMLILVDNRSEEYRVMIYCGAPKSRIVRYVTDHVLFVLTISAILGTLSYWILRAAAASIIAYRHGSVGFYLLVFAGYFSASLITSGLIMLAKAAKDGY